MSGLELLFFDGGATVAGLLSAGAAALGYQQHRRDGEELVTAPEEICHFRQALVGSHGSVERSHSALTAAWGRPLSLFGQREEEEALARGVCPRAVAAVRQAQALVEEAAELGDYADVYESQLELAASGRAPGQCCSLLRAPPYELVARLRDLERRLTAHVPRLALARMAFDGVSSGGLNLDLMDSQAIAWFEWDVPAESLAAARQGQMLESEAFFLSGMGPFRLRYWPKGLLVARAGWCSAFLWAGQAVDMQVRLAVNDTRVTLGPLHWGQDSDRGEYNVCASPEGSVRLRLELLKLEDSSERRTLPLSILRGKGRLGELWSSAQTASASDALRRLLAREGRAGDIEPVESTAPTAEREAAE